jgi:hypothetical protein
MATDQARQERIGVTVLSVGSVLIATLEWLGRPAPGDIVEADPDWYVTFNLVLHGALLLLLLVGLARLGRITGDRPGLRVPFTLMILVGIAAAAYVVGMDLGVV